MKLPLKWLTPARLGCLTPMMWMKNTFPWVVEVYEEDVRRGGQRAYRH